MRLRLTELHADHKQAKEIRSKRLTEGWKDINGVLQHQGLPYIPEIIRQELISRHHNDPLIGHFKTKKTRELVARKYYWPTFRHDVEAYVKSCDVYLASKAVCHKPYRDLQSLPVPTLGGKIS